MYVCKRTMTEDSQPLLQGRKEVETWIKWCAWWWGTMLWKNFNFIGFDGPSEHLPCLSLGQFLTLKQCFYIHIQPIFIWKILLGSGIKSSWTLELFRSISFLNWVPFLIGLIILIIFLFIFHNPVIIWGVSIFRSGRPSFTRWWFLFCTHADFHHLSACGRTPHFLLPNY